MKPDTLKVDGKESVCHKNHLPMIKNIMNFFLYLLKYVDCLTL